MDPLSFAMAAEDVDVCGVRVTRAMYIMSLRRSVADGVRRQADEPDRCSRFEIPRRPAPGGAVWRGPVSGAPAAASVNAIVRRHFQDMARYHFAFRRLQHQYGKEPIKANYERFRTEARS